VGGRKTPGEEIPEHVRNRGAGRIRLRGNDSLGLGWAAGSARESIEALRSSIVSKDIEIARRDVARILHGASANGAVCIFGNSIKTLSQNGMGVDVTFEKSPPRDSDIGRAPADCTRSFSA